MAKSVYFTQGSSFEWKVENALSVESLESDEFVFCESRWRLSLRLDGFLGITFFLNKLNAEKLSKRYKIRAFIEDRNLQPVNRRIIDLDDPDFATTHIWWISKPALRKQSDMYLTDGTLTFVAVFAPKDSLEKDAIREKVSDKSNQTSVNVDTVADLENLSLDLQHLLDDDVQSDVTLKCGERSFPAHKIFLSARSKVFAAMFRSGMEENRTGVIKISDMDAFVLDHLLHYIYSGKLSDLSLNTALSLYAAADKYSMESLKNTCAKFMTENLTRENSCKILVLADTHGDKRLKDSVLCFIASVELLRNKDVWVEFHNEHPRLAGEVIHHAYESKCRSRLN